MFAFAALKKHHSQPPLPDGNVEPDINWDGAHAAAFNPDADVDDFSRETRSFYVPQYDRACKKFWELQRDQMDYDENPTPGISGPIKKLMSMDEEELDLAVLKNDLVLSDAAVKRVVEFAEKVASRRTGTKVKLTSPATVDRHVAKACDRSDFIKRATFKVADEIPDNSARPKGLPNEIEFEWYGVVETAVELLLDNKLSTQPEGYLWEPVPFNGTYSELNTGTWWSTVCENLKAADLVPHLQVVPLIFATDGSAQDFRSSMSIQPINLAVGNYPGSVNRTDAAKRCIGYWPDFKTTTTGVAVERLNRKFYQWVFGNITEDINNYKDGIVLKASFV